MPTEHPLALGRLRSPGWGRTRSTAVVACMTLACLASRAAAQDAPGEGRAPALERDTTGTSLLLVDRETRVASVGFRFLRGSALTPDQLREGVALDGPGAFAGLRGALSFVPGISAPDVELFDPLTLQRDVVRLRRLYRTAGYPDVAIDYEVVYDRQANMVEVTHLIDQGDPLLLDSIAVTPFSADTGLALPPELRAPWSAQLRRLNEARGSRFGEQELSVAQNGTADWLHRNGYPWAQVGLAAADTTDHGVSVVLQATPGPRARVDAIEIEGRQLLSDGAARREIAFSPGDWYDGGRVSDAERELYELDLVRRALGDVPTDQPHDSTVTVRFRIEENRPRLVWGRVGWRSETGASAEAHWSHRDFLGGARTLTLSVASETGWGALEPTIGGSIGASALVRQPYLWNRRVSGSLGPFVEYRDDYRDRSLEWGITTGVLYRWLPLETFTFQYELSRVRIDDVLSLSPIDQLAQAADTAFSPAYVKSIFGISATYGRFDNRLDPRSGFLVRPQLQVSGPFGLSDIEFVRGEIEVMGALPINDAVGLFLRGSAGRLYPFGKSDPAGGWTRRSFVGLRSLMYTAGGSDDVRGWGRGMVGPKVPEVAVAADGTVTSDRYLPVGGLAVLTGSAELVLPFPLLRRPHATFTFFDAGRVWTPGNRFEPADPELALEPWAYAVGGGLQFDTPVGPIRIGVGYKLNPTRLDLLSPGDVARDLAAGGDLSGLTTDDLLRWHLHLSIGRGL